MRHVAIDLLGESVFVSAVIIGQLSLDVPRVCNGRRVLFHTNVAEVTLHFSRILDSPHDLHVFTAIGAGANIDLERASEQFGPPVIFDFLAVGAAIWAKASAFFGARHYLIPRFTVRGENTGISGQMAVWWGHQRRNFFTKLFRALIPGSGQIIAGRPLDAATNIFMIAIPSFIGLEASKNNEAVFASVSYFIAAFFYLGNISSAYKLQKTKLENSRKKAWLSNVRSIIAPQVVGAGKTLGISVGIEAHILNE